MAAQVWSQVLREPIIKEADSKADGPGLRVDLGIQGVWTTPQVEALFDKKVLDTDAPSHLHRTPESILDSGALEKKLYKKAVEDS